MKKKHVLGILGIIVICNVFLYLQLYEQLEHAASVKLHIHNPLHATECTCKAEALGHLPRLNTHVAPSAHLDDETCFFTERAVNQHRADIEIFDAYQNIRISYPQYVYTHTGWIQQYDIQYDASQWDDQVLQVYVVPFSHNDPGWLNTYDTYYTSWTKRTLDEAVYKLTRDTTLRFTWAETIFLERWYREASPDRKSMFHRLVNESRFDIVTGGWVMTDEAVAHYYAMLDQLLHGHQWLNQTLGITPKNAWALDPFGNSATMAYLLKRSGIENMLIQRVHFAIKKHLANSRHLEFHWRQVWDPGSFTDIFCHTTPFLLYNIVYSCGPDIQTCCKYDFTAKRCWKWGKYVKATPVDDENVRTRSEELLDQYRKKAQLYKTNVLLVPHGDDFRYTSENEWDQQMNSLKKLFHFMNVHPDMKIKVQLATLSEYFEAVRRYQSSQGTPVEFPSLSGDFFTYNDRDDQYWSGYFTSRPFLKSRIRTFQSRLRAAEILYTLALTKAQSSQSKYSAERQQVVQSLYDALGRCRAGQGLLQHHDAVTGTARKAVVHDYLTIVHKSIHEAESVIVKSASIIHTEIMEDDDLFTMLEVTPDEHSLPDQLVLETGEERFVLVYNPVALEQTTVIRVRSSSAHVMVQDWQQRRLACQVEPVWLNVTVMSTQQYQVAFSAVLPPLGMVKFQLVPVEEFDTRACPTVHIKVLNALPNAQDVNSLFNVRWVQKSSDASTVHSDYMQIYTCPCTGLLQGIIKKEEGILHKAQIQMLHYGTGSWTNPWRDKSGAYVFMPDGPATEMEHKNPVIQVAQGPVVSSVTSRLPNVTQTASIWNVPGPHGVTVHIDNYVDVRDSQNHELSMRLLTEVESGNDFFVDSNGFQTLRRRTQSRIPIQGNFYPMTTHAYIEDELFRVNLHSAQSHGVASLNSGELEVVLERHLVQDDWRGLNEGVTDNLPVHQSFLLTVETRSHTMKNKSASAAGFPSLLAHTLSHALDNPPLVLRALHAAAPLAGPPYEPLNQGLACDLHLVNLRAEAPRDHGDASQALLLLHRRGVDCSFPKDHMGCTTSHGKVKWTEIFAKNKVMKIEEMSLTGQRSLSAPHHAHVRIPPMEIKTYNIHLR